MMHRLHLSVLGWVLGWVLAVDGVPGVAAVRKKPPLRRVCLQLPEEILQQMYGRLTVGVMSAFHYALQLDPNDQHNASCPSAAWATATTGTRLPVNLLSISPWAYRMLYDSSRYPRSIPEAYCLCQGCLIGAYGQESMEFRSTPVYAPTVVLKRSGSCVAGRYTYNEVYVSVAVGCTCVPVLEQDQEESSSQSIPRKPHPSNRTKM